MSLVNYSSDEEDEAEMLAHERQPPQNPSKGAHQLGSSLAPSSSTPSSSTSFPSSFSLVSSQSAQDMGPNTMNSSERTPVKLPNVSELMDSHSSMQDTVMQNFSGSKSISRKRPEDRPLAASHGKIPRTSKDSTHRISPDIAKGSLLPPQLRGRSNIATEDLDKLFSRRQKTNL